MAEIYDKKTYNQHPFAVNFRRLRGSTPIKKIARAAQMAPTNLYHLDKHQDRAPSMGQVYRLGRALGVTPAMLLLPLEDLDEVMRSMIKVFGLPEVVKSLGRAQANSETSCPTIPHVV